MLIRNDQLYIVSCRHIDIFIGGSLIIHFPTVLSSILWYIMKTRPEGKHTAPNSGSSLVYLYKIVRKFKNKESILLSTKQYSAEDIEVVINKLKDNEVLKSMWLQSNKMPKLTKIISQHSYANL